MESAQIQLQALLGERSEAVGRKDIDLLLAFYAHDIIYFDLVPPLEYRGITALRERFLDWFDRFEGPIRQEIADLTIWPGSDIAAASMLIQAGGVLKGERPVEYWVRATTGFRRRGDNWSIIHEHVSVPVDLERRAAVLDLNP